MILWKHQALASVPTNIRQISNADPPRSPKEVIERSSLGAARVRFW